MRSAAQQAVGADASAWRAPAPLNGTLGRIDSDASILAAVGRRAGSGSKLVASSYRRSTTLGANAPSRHGECCRGGVRRLGERASG